MSSGIFGRAIVQNKPKRSVAFLAIPNEPKYYRWHIAAPTYQVLDTPNTTMRHINVSKCPLSVCPSPRPPSCLSTFQIKIRGTPIIDHFARYSLFHPLPRTLLSRILFTYFQSPPPHPPRYCTSEPEGSLSSVFPSLREKKRQIRCNKICWLCTHIHIIITHRSCASPAYILTHSHTIPVHTTTGNARR